MEKVISSDRLQNVLTFNHSYRVMLRYAEHFIEFKTIFRNINT